MNIGDGLKMFKCTKRGAMGGEHEELMEEQCPTQPHQRGNGQWGAVVAESDSVVPGGWRCRKASCQGNSARRRAGSVWSLAVVWGGYSAVAKSKSCGHPILLALQLVSRHFRSTILWALPTLSDPAPDHDVVSRTGGPTDPGPGAPESHRRPPRHCL